jgi:Arc/MetJ family transcription regulator
MPVKRTTIELDEWLVAEARRATGETLRATVERALQLLIDEHQRRSDAAGARLAAYAANGLVGIDVDVLLSDEAWR